MSEKKRKKKQRITLQDTLREILQPEQPGYVSQILMSVTWDHVASITALNTDAANALLHSADR